MELLKEKQDCCGCRTCEKVCPKQAITMVEDECGFLYPSISKDKCVDCGLCLQKCAFQSGYKTRKEFEPFYGYGARHKLEKVYMNSRSGGAFVALSNLILDQEGIVYGAGYSPEEGFHRVIHKRTTDGQDRDELCGSKYVQSDLTDTFLSVKKDLEDGKKVIFSGTGCQVGALHMYLGREYDNLFTIDIVCHGTPSPKIWSDYLDMREKEYQGKVTYVNFRNKRKYGWTKHRELLKVGDRKIDSRIYSRLFSKALTFRPSCFNCIYTNTNRPGDITIADFWGHEKAIPGKWDDEKGISLVLVNTNQGMKLWEEAKEQMEWIDCTGYPFRHQNMKRPTTKPEQYDEFWSDYKANGFEYCLKKYLDYTSEIKKVNKSDSAGDKDKLKEVNSNKGNISEQKDSSVKNIIKKFLVHFRKES